MVCTQRRRAELSGDAISVLMLLLLVVGCSDNEYVPPPTPAVTVSQPLVHDVTEYLEHTGTTRAVEAIQIRARVEGFLQSMHFQQGEMVEEGDLLFIIDPEPFELELKAATARMTSSKAELDLAQTEFERMRVLYQKAATSEINYIKARANRDSAAANFSLAQANQRTAELDLEYAHVRAPISGRVGRHEVDMGNLVGTDGATLLSEIVVYSPLYVYFYISEREVFMLQEDSARRRKKMGKDWKHRDPSPIYVGRSGQDGYPFSGLVDYTALQIDAATGTFEVRGLLPNVGTLDEILMPGTFVRVQVPIAERKNALLVPERALGADQNGRFLLIANSENVVEQRSVQVGPARRDGTRVIKTGLTAQDWVITNGLQRARPGAKVDPTKEKLKSVSSEADRLKPVWPEGVRRPGAKDERVRPLSADGGHLPGDDEGSASDDTKTKPSEAPDSARDAATAGASPIEAGPAMSDPSKPAPADTTNPSIPPSQPVAPTGGQ